MRTIDSCKISMYALALGLVVGLSACATAGESSDRPDAGDRADAPPSASCGNGEVDPGEACDGTNLNGEDCVSRGFEGGILACAVANCSFVTDNCYSCGDDTVNGDEECDGADLGGATCESLGYLGGTLGCDPGTCGYDISGCQTAETLTNDDGACDVSLGCNSTDGSGTTGNPQNLVECFRSATIDPPFWLTQFSYQISATAGDQPNSLNLEVYAWTGSGPPGTLIGSEGIPGNQLTAGPHTITLNNPVQITTPDFCIGVNGSDVNDGFRIMFSDSAQEFGASYWRLPTCNIPNFTAVATDFGPGNFCMSPTIDMMQP